MNVLKTKSDTSNGQPGDWTVETKPWLRRRRESRVAYAAAQVYFELPGKRSIEEAARRCKKHESLLGDWSTKYDWVERAKAYDAWLTQIEQVAIERVATENAAKWAQRLEDQHEVTFQCSEQLIDSGKTLHKLPFVDFKSTVEKDADGRATVTNTYNARRVNKADEIRYVVEGLNLRDKAIRGATHTEVKMEDKYVSTPYIGEKEKK